jgi:dephospho-CoA kinase
VQQGKSVIGLLGGIGAGKSHVAREIEQFGGLLISSDQLNHEILGRPEVLRELESWWGSSVSDGGKPDRRRIAAIIFSNSIQRQRLESLMHPLIAQRRTDMITAVKDNPAVTAIVIDSPLLLESNLDRECDALVFVDTSDLRRLQRLEAQRGWTATEVRRREGWQLPLIEKRSRADFIIDNDGPVERLRPQVADILQTIFRRPA